MTYANKTSVSIQKSKGEIETIIRRYGASEFGYVWRGDREVIGFTYNGRLIRFQLPMPARVDFINTPTGLKRSVSAQEKEFDQACRSRWRALTLCIKAKLEAVEAGITTFEDEFLAQTVMPNGSTVGEWAEAQLNVAIESGKMPKLLPSVAGR